MAKRKLIVVDLETTGLIKGFHSILEVAAVDADSGKQLHFVPCVLPGTFDNAEGQAMKTNRYFERGVYEDRLNSDQTIAMYGKLQEMLRGNTFAGMNPKFDWEFLEKDPFLTAYGPILSSDEWHYAPADLGMYACAFLGLDPAACPHLSGPDGILDRMGVANDCEHGALGDACAATNAFNKIRDLGKGRSS